MTLIRRAILALALTAGITPAFAQVPAAVPALPDAERRSTYSLTASTCACTINFALYGDGTDFQNWIEVWIQGVRYDYNDASHGWTVTSPSGSLANLPRPITNAVLTFNAPQSGTVQILGARRPRRTSQFNENAGVPARNINQVITDLTAMEREFWDLRARMFLAAPGGTGTTVGGLTGVYGPASSTNNALAVWNGTSGGALLDSSVLLPPGGPMNVLGTGAVVQLGIPNATRMQIVDGSAALPVTVDQPTVLISRYETEASQTGSSGAIYASSVGSATTTQQPTAIQAYAYQLGNNDACGVCARAEMHGPTAHAALGMFSFAGAYTSGTSAEGIELQTTNSTGQNSPYFANLIGKQVFLGIDNNYDGGTSITGTAAMVVRSVNGKWDVGIGFNRFNSISPTLTADIQTDSDAGTIMLAHSGAHINGLDLIGIGSTYSGNAYMSPGFAIGGTGTLLFTNKAAPSTPSAGTVNVWSDSTDGRLHDKNSSGVVGTTVVPGGGAANNFVTGITAAGGVNQAQPAFSNLSGSVAASQMPALTGDVTSSAGAVATTIAANVVTYAKFQQVAASSLVGNATGSLANATGITLGATLAFSGSALQTAAHTGDVTTAANSFATTIAANAVTYAKLQQVAASSIVGNATGSLANATGITLGATLAFSGSALQTAAHTGDVTTAANSFATTLATVNSNVGTFGTSTAVPAVTVNGKGLITAISTNAIPTGSSATLGLARCDNVTITCGSGIFTAIGAAAISVDASGSGPATTIANGKAGYALTQTASGNFMTNNQLFSAAGGFVNKVRNGTFDIWSRGTSALATSSAVAGAYTADGWQVTQNGAQFTCAQSTGNNGSLFSLQCVGGTSNTGTVFRQPIESYFATPLASATITVQFQYKQDTGGSITPKLSTCAANTTDSFGTCNADLASTSLTACASGSWCTEAYTLSASANASKGYRIEIDCNTALTAAQHCSIAAVDVRVTPNVATGVNASPPPPELRAVGSEMVFNQRYYWRRNFVTNQYIAVLHAVSATTATGTLFNFPPMRAGPTLNLSAAASFSAQLAAGGGSASSALPMASSVDAVWTNGVATFATGLAAGNASQLFANTTAWIDASSEL